MKNCPFCDEEIKDNAVKCKHCGSMLNAPMVEAQSANADHKGSISSSVPDPFDDGARGTTTFIGPGYKIEDRYEILFKLGEGGMGQVFLTQDTQLDNEPRAIKILPDQVRNDFKAVNRLKDEAKITMSLSHPNIVKLYNYGNDGKVHYLIMEYVNGIDLLTYTALKGKIAEKEVRRIGIEVAKALQIAHEYRHHNNDKGIIHRDIKPANILLESRDLDIKAIKSKGTNLQQKDIQDLTGATVKLTDFGIARQVRESMSRYSRGDTSGTLLYMSPEQYENRGVDHRSDLYSLGVTLYELLSGDPPFTGESISYQIMSRKPDPIEGISDEFNTIILKLLEKDKEKRYRVAGELISRLSGKADKAMGTIETEERKKKPEEEYKRNVQSKTPLADEEKELITCVICKGTSKAECLSCENGECSRCEGSGKCWWCNDGEREDCDECNNTGKCEECGGTGKCNICKGTMLAECPGCGGTKLVNRDKLWRVLFDKYANEGIVKGIIRFVPLAYNILHEKDKLDAGNYIFEKLLYFKFPKNELEKLARIIKTDISMKRGKCRLCNKDGGLMSEEEAGDYVCYDCSHPETNFSKDDPFGSLPDLPDLPYINNIKIERLTDDNKKKQFEVKRLINVVNNVICLKKKYSLVVINIPKKNNYALVKVFKTTTNAQWSSSLEEDILWGGSSIFIPLVYDVSWKEMCDVKKDIEAVGGITKVLSDKKYYQFIPPNPHSNKIFLKEIGNNKMALIKLIKKVTGLDLRKIHEEIRKLPWALPDNIVYDKDLAKRFKDLGAIIESKEVSCICFALHPGKANPSPPVGWLSSLGIDVMKFCLKFNEVTKEMSCKWVIVKVEKKINGSSGLTIFT